MEMVSQNHGVGTLLVNRTGEEDQLCLRHRPVKFCGDGNGVGALAIDIVGAHRTTSAKRDPGVVPAPSARQRAAIRRASSPPPRTATRSKTDGDSKGECVGRVSAASANSANALFMITTG